MTKYIFVTGGVVSGLGKGITAASLGALLKMRGAKVFAQKFDPYLNVDPGTMSPFTHGEVFVTDDGAETDLDLGHYERFIDEELSRKSNLTMGMIYSSVLQKERNGEYLGNDVQMVPNITDEIKEYILSATKEKKPDFQIIEIGGTVGDIESLPFLESIRQLSLEVGRENCVFIHTTLVPYLAASNEHKTRPTQHSVKTLMGVGIIPDFVVLRSNEKIKESAKDKISKLCTIKKGYVISAPNLDSIYKVPIILHEQKMDDLICQDLKYKGKINLTPWNRMLKAQEDYQTEITIGIVGKYVELEDAYFSVREALKHAGFFLKAKVNIKWLEAEDTNLIRKLKKLDGILVPGGFGSRGIEGKIKAITYARTHKIPFLGICLGMQLAVIEYMQNVLGIKEANSTEFQEATKIPVIDYLPDQYKGIEFGGTMRLGAFPCHVKKGTLAHKLYGKQQISERHRHRYEFNNKYRDEFINTDLGFAGINETSDLIEIIELKNHPFFIASQFHPEFKSRPTKPHPLFKGLVEASLTTKK